MDCARCGSPRTRTLETRDSPGNTIRRRKVCRSCGHNFSTVERIEVYIEGQWIPLEGVADAVAVPAPAPANAELDAVAAEVAKETKGKTKQIPRYWPVELEHVQADMPGLPLQLQQQVVTWWNVARRAKHGTKATWTKNAFQLSAHRAASLWAKGQQDLAVQMLEEANEAGWQALKVDYLRPIYAGRSAPEPAPAGLVPRSPAMQQAVETWNSAA